MSLLAFAFGANVGVTPNKEEDMMRFSSVVLVLCTYLFSACLACADDNATCTDGKGTLIVGVVATAPKFAPAKEKRKGVELSHTHIGVKSDLDNKVYDVAIDNIFASDYVKNSKSSPPSLMGIKIGDRVELCGQTYTHPLVIHWVHTNCGNTPTPSSPAGWVKIIKAGQAGSSLEDNQTYCALWPSMKGHAFKLN